VFRPPSRRAGVPGTRDRSVCARALRADGVARHTRRCAPRGLKVFSYAHPFAVSHSYSSRGLAQELDPRALAPGLKLWDRALGSSSWAGPSPAGSGLRCAGAGPGAVGVGRRPPPVRACVCPPPREVPARIGLAFSCTCRLLARPCLRGMRFFKFRFPNTTAGSVIRLAKLPILGAPGSMHQVGSEVAGG